MVCYGVIQKIKTKFSHIRCAMCNDFTPVCLCFLSRLFRFDKIFSSLCVENEKLGSVLLCFLGVALLKIVYKKANQRADFDLYKYISGFSVQLNDIVLNKSRAIAGQRGSSLLYQQWYTVMLLCCWENINFSIYFGR